MTWLTKRPDAGAPPNKGMKLTKLSAAPTLAPQAALGRRCRRMPAPANGMDAGTASQLIPSVLADHGAEGELDAVAPHAVSTGGAGSNRARPNDRVEGPRSG